jgi:hypothetical protein
VSPAQKDVICLAFIVRQGKGGIFQKFNVTINEFGFAAAALTFLAAMHKGNALTKRGVKHGFTFLDLHLDADGLKPHLMYLHFRHVSDFHAWLFH